MNNKVRGLLTMLVLGSALVSGQTSMAAPAAPRLSPGCQFINSVTIDGVTGGVGFNELFFKGEAITFTAAEPSDGEPLTLIGAIGGLSGPNTISTPFPGSVTLTIPKKGQHVVQGSVVDSHGVAQGATFTVSCAAGS